MATHDDRTRAMDAHLKEVFFLEWKHRMGQDLEAKDFVQRGRRCCCRCNSIEPNGSTRQISYSGNGYDGDLVAPMIRDVGLALAMGDTVVTLWLLKWARLVEPKRWSRWCRRTRSSHRCLARGRASTNCTASNRKCDHDGLPLQDGNNHSVDSMWLYWRRSIILRRILGSHQSRRSTRLPICYILQNNQIALDTPPAHQSGVELWADKAVAMGFPAWTIDGSDPAAWHASVATAREFSLEGGGQHDPC